MLLIDDSVEIHRLLSVRLRTENIALEAVDNAVEGIRLAKSKKPALILLDLDMPVMDGFEALRALKDDSETTNIPVIVISGSDETDDKVGGFDLGAVDYVCKPFKMPELRARLRSALRIQELMTMLAQRAQIDGLTGLWNRAYFDDRLAEEVAARDRTNRPLTLVMCDLDHFKALNDTHGHPAGDTVLEGFAQILTRNIRGMDVACRYGGEEFALILRDTDAGQAQSLIERIRAELEQSRWPRHPERRITASFGVCDRPSGAVADPRAWIEAADRAMYEAKSRGRNCIYVLSEDNGPEPTLAKAS